MRDSSQNSFYVKRTSEGSINLFRYNDTLEPHGKFCCKIADDSDITHTACIDIGEFVSFKCIIKKSLGMRTESPLIIL
jgi:hypothetical protein